MLQEADERLCFMLLQKLNELNWVLGHLRAHKAKLGQTREATADGEMNEMTLPSRHRIRNSIPGGLKPSRLPLGHRGSS